MKVNIKTKTDGSGIWSGCKRKIHIYKIEINYLNRDDEYGELIAYFYNKDWDVEKHGLIYTDRHWIKDFRNGLRKIGFTKKAYNDVEYSEQGMQGDNYVSMDFGCDFLKHWDKMEKVK